MASRRGVYPFLSGRRMPDNRTIRITPIPYPIRFKERRAILQVLEQHTRLESFRQDIDRPGTFVAIVKDEAVVEDMVQRSPLEIRIPVSHRAHGSLAITKKGSDLRETPASTQDTSEVSGNSWNHSSNQYSDMNVFVYPEPDFNHLNASVKDEQSGAWSHKDMVNPSFATTALQELVPKGLAGDGLAWWNHDAHPHRDPLSVRRDRTLRSYMPSKMKDFDAKASLTPGEREAHRQAQRKAQKKAMKTKAKDKKANEEEAVENEGIVREEDNEDDTFSLIEKMRVEK